MRDSKKNELGNRIAKQCTIHDVIPDISSESWKKVADGVYYFTNCHGRLATPFRQY